MRLLITGCRGFIGGSLGRFAAAAGHEVLGIGRSSQPPLDWPSRYACADAALADLAPALQEFQPDAVFHGAGSASVGASFATPLDDLRAMLFTWANTLDSVRRSGLRPLLLYPSSAAVYGAPAGLPVKETAPAAPISPYGFHKLASELLAHEYAHCFGLRVVICRLFSVFGPAQRRLLVWQLFEQIDSASPKIALEGTGEETRDYLHADDLSAALLRLAATEVAVGECRVLNIASGTATRVSDLARLLAEICGVEKPLACGGRVRPGDPPRWQADVSRLRETIGDFNPPPLGERLAACVKEWRR